MATGMSTFRRNMPLLAICQALMMSGTSLISTWFSTEFSILKTDAYIIRGLYLLKISRFSLYFFLSWRLFPFADTAAFVAAPLAGKAVRAGMFLLATVTFRYIDHPEIVGQFLKTHNSHHDIGTSAKRLYFFYNLTIMDSPLPRSRSFYPFQGG